MLWALWFKFSAVFGALGVILGAFAAHGLKGRLSPESMSIFETAVKYQMYHAFALIGVGVLAMRVESTSIKLAGIFFILGTIIFSGSLYLLVATDTKWLGAITPIGGLALILGWVFVYVAVFSL